MVSDVAITPADALAPWGKMPQVLILPRFMPGEYNKVRKICAEASEEAARIQVELMRNEDPRIQLIATEAVLNRGVGKPRDHSEEEKKRRRVDLSGLDSDELKELGKLLKKALGIDG